MRPEHVALHSLTESNPGMGQAWTAGAPPTRDTGDRATGARAGHVTVRVCRAIVVFVHVLFLKN